MSSWNRKRSNYKAFKHVEILFVQGRNLVPIRPAIGWWGLFTFHQPIPGLLGTRFLPLTNKVSTCRKAIMHCSVSANVICGLTHFC